MTVTPPEYGGCLWPTDPQCYSEEWDDLDDTVRDLALAYASATLERLTGFRVGQCPIKLRPCRQRASSGFPGGFYAGPGYYPQNWNGIWTNVCDFGQNGCATDCEVALPAPVSRVDEVRANGSVVPEGNYEVHNDHILVWTGTGDCPWNIDQDMSKPDTAEGTFSVTYLNAYPVDQLGANSVTLLALQFAKACTNSKNCQLPPNVTTLVRQGVSMQIAAGSFPGGKTGMRTVDSYVALWNPKGLTRAPVVYSPDLAQHRVVT